MFSDRPNRAALNDLLIGGLLEALDTMRNVTERLLAGTADGATINGYFEGRMQAQYRAIPAIRWQALAPTLANQTLTDMQVTTSLAPSLNTLGSAMNTLTPILLAYRNSKASTWELVAASGTYIDENTRARLLELAAGLPQGAQTTINQMVANQSSHMLVEVPADFSDSPQNTQLVNAINAFHAAIDAMDLS